jgi:hypothetical protein
MITKVNNDTGSKQTESSGVLRQMTHKNYIGPIRQAVFWLISQLWLICCERKTLFHG